MSLSPWVCLEAVVCFSLLLVISCGQNLSSSSPWMRRGVTLSLPPTSSITATPFSRADPHPCAVPPRSGRRLASPEEPQHRRKQHRGLDQRAEHQRQPHRRAQRHAGQLQRDGQLRRALGGHPERRGPLGGQGQVQQVTELMGTK